MSALTDLFDMLVFAESRRRAATDIAEGLRAKATAMALERYTDEGGKTWKRPEGGITVIEPKPAYRVEDADAFAEWLVEFGRGDLVVERVEIIDQPALLAVVAFLRAQPPPTDGPGRSEPSGADVEALERTLIKSCRIVAEPVRDAAEHLHCAISGSGTLVTADGEIVPGVRWVQAAPSSIKVDVAKASREGARAVLAAETGMSS